MVSQSTIAFALDFINRKCDYSATRYLVSEAKPHGPAGSSQAIASSGRRHRHKVGLGKARTAL